MKLVQVGGRGMDCNQFLLKDPKSNRFDLVDAGLGTDFENVLARVREIIDPARIGTIAISHEHLDHVNGLPAWKQFGAKIVTSPACAQKLRAGHDPTSAMFGADIPRMDVDQKIQDGDTIQLGGRDMQALLTPGHSPGSACYWEPKDGLLFAGDTLFANGGIGRFDFPDGDVRQLYESILRLEKLPVQVLHSGHGPSMEGELAARSVKGSVAHVSSCI